MSYNLDNSSSGYIAISGCVNINNYVYNNKLCSEYVYTPHKPKTFYENLEEELNNWHGNIIKELLTI